MNVAVNALTSQGWLGSPLAGAQLSGVVPVTVASQQGYKIQSGILTLTSMANLDAPITLNSNTTTTTSTGQIGTIDTTTLPNGSYYLLLNATDDHGTTMGSGIWLTVVGDYKPGRVTTTITDAIVPAPGLPIRIERSYDSALRSRSRASSNCPDPSAPAPGSID